MSRSILTMRQNNDAIVDVDPHESVVARRTAVDVVRIAVLGVAPALGRRRTGEALEDDAAAHGHYVGHTPDAVVEEV